ncbi:MULTISPECIES: hypothetical protein [Pseudanabaena]|uniref:Uncharacterized protein n=2 Tax=Pseudanabaena TaxID=1152 RepID=L8N1Q8_9CYAN|nr:MULTISPECIES: hypothetical protein [Pseudanabaena]ELS33646.1 hypothetical protein Pse7429DRAFT_1047 [Pseudanabaena biceps PCC 7429]MDG3494139.1 hypothetical protein [Pseudanabaena catenata USMAC16]TYQ31427.1 hypothetical protein PseudUWO310_03815 [Pseudanabaena sp. UWO310]
MSKFFGWLVTLLLLSFAGFGLTQWFNLPFGNFVDWVIAASIFVWLIIIVTVPWNIYFQSRSVLDRAKISKERGVNVDENQLPYVRSLAQRSLGIALGLHLISAIVLYVLAATGVGTIGYIGAIAALLLTILRPAISAYEYISQRLRAILQQIDYPQEDIMELRQRFATLEELVRQINTQLNTDNPYSWVSKYEQFADETRKDLSKLVANIEDLRATNNSDHERLVRESRQAIAQLSTDSQFLEHVREIIRFFKSA